MSSVGILVNKFQSLFGTSAEQAASDSDVIVRERKFTATSLAATFVLGHLANPQASFEQLAQMSAAVGTPLTPQAVEQRFSDRLVQFLRGLFNKAIQTQVPAQRVLAPLLERFSDVQVLDSTTITLPSELAQEFPGCGGPNEGGKAAMKLQMQLSLKTGCLDAVSIEAGKVCDLATPLQQNVPVVGSLRITDLGYFDTEVLDRISAAGAYWLTPLAQKTNVYDVDGTELDFLGWLNRNGPVIDREILVGSERKVRCRLIAWRLPEEVANRRRQKLNEEAKRKGRTLSRERLARCDWATLITNVPQDRLSINEARALYRARWQIELLFKRWKSQGRVADMSGSSATRCLVKMWSRLLAALLQHWVQSGVWGRPEISLKKVWDLICSMAHSIAIALHHPDALTLVLEKLVQMTQSTARQNKRKKPSTFELLNDPEKNPYPLT
jgi:hypothetical protein